MSRNCKCGGRLRHLFENRDLFQVRCTKCWKVYEQRKRLSKEYHDHKAQVEAAGQRGQGDGTAGAPGDPGAAAGGSGQQDVPVAAQAG